MACNCLSPSLCPFCFLFSLSLSHLSLHSNICVNVLGRMLLRNKSPLCARFCVASIYTYTCVCGNVFPEKCNRWCAKGRSAQFADSEAENLARFASFGHMEASGSVHNPPPFLERRVLADGTAIIQAKIRIREFDCDVPENWITLSSASPFSMSHESGIFCCSFGSCNAPLESTHAHTWTCIWTIHVFCFSLVDPASHTRTHNHKSGIAPRVAFFCRLLLCDVLGHCACRLLQRMCLVMASPSTWWSLACNQVLLSSSSTPAPVQVCCPSILTFVLTSAPCPASSHPLLGSASQSIFPPCSADAALSLRALCAAGFGNLWRSTNLSWLHSVNSLSMRVLFFPLLNPPW